MLTPQRSTHASLMTLSMVSRPRFITMVDCEGSWRNEIAVDPVVALSGNLSTYNNRNPRYGRAVHRDRAALW